MRSKEYYEKKFNDNNEVCELEEVVCPYCFQAQDDEPSAYGLERNGDREEIKCHHCDETFTAKAHVEISVYTSRKKK